MLSIRLAFGIIFFAHGAQKLFGWFGGHGLSATGAFFESSGFSPGAAIALLVGMTELLGGLGLMLGLLTRVASLGLGVVMLVAMFAVHWKNGFFLGMGPEQPDGIEHTLALLAGLIATFVYGAGSASLDRSLWRRYQKRHQVTS